MQLSILSEYAYCTLPTTVLKINCVQLCIPCLSNLFNESVTLWMYLGSRGNERIWQPKTSYFPLIEPYYKWCSFYTLASPYLSISGLWHVKYVCCFGLVQGVALWNLILIPLEWLAAECTAKEAFQYAGEDIIFASGSPFRDVDLGACPFPLLLLIKFTFLLCISTAKSGPNNILIMWINNQDFGIMFMIILLELWESVTVVVNYLSASTLASPLNVCYHLELHIVIAS